VVAVPLATIHRESAVENWGDSRRQGYTASTRDGRSDEREQVLLTERVERDVCDDHHLADPRVEEGSVEQRIWICAVAGGQFPLHTMDAAATGNPPA
jgi:hypothetical protein